MHNEVRHDLLASDARQLAATLSRDLLWPLLVLNRPWQSRRAPGAAPSLRPARASRHHHMASRFRHWSTWGWRFPVPGSMTSSASRSLPRMSQFCVRLRSLRS
ncbi:DUF935 domain-containing protein [Pseudomonas aeruginosa]|nr:DUF935 domain-containing protein [Pseudomonas aeruginosa]